ncbi:hypothetical protein ACIBI9_57715 [Nonomuraea sp. NPDC050451]|uniref:hypothetical protein n=1 Tax=Nonomuraea sp. NPDC050451 TaxID=3364364 RepID=UPI0037A4E0BE
MGTPLPDRSGRLRLNDTGELFRRYVERFLGDLDAGRRAVQLLDEAVWEATSLDHPLAGPHVGGHRRTRLPAFLQRP